MTIFMFTQFNKDALDSSGFVAGLRPDMGFWGFFEGLSRTLNQCWNKFRTSY